MPSQLELPFIEEEPRPADPLADRIVAAGLAPNDFILKLNGSLTNPHPLPLPSRLYRFPIEFVSLNRLRVAPVPGGNRLLLRHPGLASLPFVQEVAEKVGTAPAWQPIDEFGRDRGCTGRWWHAVDLMTEKHWRDLLATRHLTDEREMAKAICIRLHYDRGGLSLASARAILSAIGEPEPQDRSRGQLLGEGISPWFHEKSRGTAPGGYWAVNIRDRGAAGAWVTVHGIEDGWFIRGKDGHLKMSEEGLRRRGIDAPARDRSGGLSAGNHKTFKRRR